MKQDEELRNMSNWDLLDLYTKEARWAHWGGTMDDKPSGYSSSVLWDEIVNRMVHGVYKLREIKK